MHQVAFTDDANEFPAVVYHRNDADMFFENNLGNFLDRRIGFHRRRETPLHREPSLFFLLTSREASRRAKLEKIYGSNNDFR